MTGSARSSAPRRREHYVYELFLDDKGQKISKSKGNGLTIDEWLTYADPDSLSLYMYNKPREAKKLYFDVIPRAVDDYAAFLSAYPRQEAKDRLMNPVWHIHQGKPPQPEEGAHLLRAAAQPRGGGQCRGQVRALGLHPALCAALSARDASAPRFAHRLCGALLRRFREAEEAVSSCRRTRRPWRCAIWPTALGQLPEGTSPEEIQQKVYDVGRRDPYKTVLKDGSTGVAQGWFNMLYQVLLGEEKGPRFGSFVALYGIGNTRALIESALNGDLVTAGIPAR